MSLKNQDNKNSVYLRLQTKDFAHASQLQQANDLKLLINAFSWQEQTEHLTALHLAFPFAWTAHNTSSLEFSRTIQQIEVTTPFKHLFLCDNSIFYLFLKIKYTSLCNKTNHFEYIKYEFLNDHRHLELIRDVGLPVMTGNAWVQTYIFNKRINTQFKPIRTYTLLM